MIVERLKSLVGSDLAAVNSLIVDKIQSQIDLIDDLSTYIVEGGGKRLRPILVLLASRACNYEGQEHIPLAAMVEFFHTATLLHDDVVDESTLRRGRETANSIWGSKASILVGDYLFTQSVQLMVDANNTAILRLMADTSHKISCGEVKQLANRHNLNFTIEDYLDVIRSKTALLFAACSAIGPLLAFKSKAIEEGLYNYGLHLGIAFQLIDDALDYSSNAQAMGKNRGDDLADGKITLPLLHVLNCGSPEQSLLVKQSLKEGSLAHLQDILDAIEETKAIEFTHDFASKEVDAAISALSILPDSIYKQALIDLANFSLNRTH